MTANMRWAPKSIPSSAGVASHRPTAANNTRVASTQYTTGFHRPNHSAAPTNPPMAAVINGIATPCTPACASITVAGRSPAVTPVANCGAIRDSVAAAVKLIALSDPITKPSNDFRVGPDESHHDRGHEHQDRPADRYRNAHQLREPSRGCVGQRHIVETRDQRSGRERPSDAEPDAQQCGRHQYAKGQVAVNIRFVQVEQKDQRKAECADRDHWRLPPQQAEGDQQQKQNREADSKHIAGAQWKVGKE